MFLKKIKFILILYLLYQTPLYSKSASFNDFDSKNLSKYFSGIVAFENKENSLALDYFNSSKVLLDKHDPYLKRYVSSLVLENKVSQAINVIKNKKGSIVNNSSISAFANVGGNLSYAASKGGVMSLTRVLAIEYAKNNIRVNAVCPGVIDTPMNERNLKKTKNKKELISKWKTITPLGRVASPYELAQTVLFLSSDMSSFITGVGLLVDGGRAAT